MPSPLLGLVATSGGIPAFVNDFTGPLMPLHKFITIAALALAPRSSSFIFNLIYSRYKGAPAPENPM